MASTYLQQWMQCKGTPLEKYQTPGTHLDSEIDVTLKWMSLIVFNGLFEVFCNWISHDRWRSNRKKWNTMKIKWFVCVEVDVLIWL